jgi:cellulose synthase/poly-beta-1,6-N-acetylglucosamine synthase-like glycosyltransferase
MTTSTFIQDANRTMAEAGPNSRCTLTCVVIGRNEEKVIGNAIQSLLDVRKELPDTEVIFVDSASTDKSVEIACQYPIRVLQLRPEWQMSASAGRYIGFLWAKGEYIFFLDGDAVVDAAWLVKGVEFMKAHPEYGSVAGVLDEIYVDENGGDGKLAPNVFQQDLSKDIDPRNALGGTAMYRREVLERVGGFQPWLKAAEDDEMHLRVRLGGWKVARIKGYMGVKFTENRHTLREIMRRARSSMYNYGAVLRYCQEYNAGWRYCVDTIPWVVSTAVIVMVLLAIIPICVYFGVVHWLPVAALVLFLALAAKKRSFKGAMLSVAVRTVGLYRTFTSYWVTKPRKTSEYPTDVIVVK